MVLFSINLRDFSDLYCERCISVAIFQNTGQPGSQGPVGPNGDPGTPGNAGRNGPAGWLFKIVIFSFL
jgi:hypothetical protein